VGCANKYIPTVNSRFINTIGNGDAFRKRMEVMIIDRLRYSLPTDTSILNRPTNSFFFVSTLMMGLPCCAKASRIVAIYSNCSFRSGEVACAIDLRLTFKEKPISFSRWDTVLGLTSMPILRSSSAIFSVVRLLHFKPVIGSPAASCSSNFSMAEIISGVFFYIRSPRP